MIQKILLALALLALAACGGQDTAAGDADVAASPPASETATGESGSATGGAASPVVASCLDLVDQERWSQALPVCTRALGMDPENNDVQRALETAKAESARQAGAASEKLAEGQAAADDAAQRAGTARQNAEDAAASAGAARDALLGE